jgi:threo-3-hydroxy-L-aspartate ammonia-lyase
VGLETFSDLPVSYGDVAAAAARLDGHAHRTPVMTSRIIDESYGANFFFKCENLQRTGSFKFRGAYNAVATLSSEERARGVLAFSSGNHAQAIACAARLQGTSATLVMPQDAPALKVEATRGYGGEIIFYDRYTEDREAISDKLAKEKNLALIPSYDHPQVVAGQGTATKELLEEVGPLDRLFVCLGGGGLLAGAALAVRQSSPRCKIIGVEPDAGSDGQQSFRAGRIIHIPVPKSIADGAIVTHLGQNTFPIIHKLVDDIVSVSDKALVDAMRVIAERMKLVVEPTGCLAAAAAFSRAFHRSGERVGVLVSGGNIDATRFARLLLDLVP